MFKFGESYFYDKNLQMGCSSSCKIFETFSTAIQWILNEKLHIPGISHYVDVFVIIACSEQECNLFLKKFQDMAFEIGLPLAPDNTFKALQVMKSMLTT